MKKLLLTLTVALLAITTILAQAPQAFKYQAIARDASGNTLADQAIGIKVNILQGSQDGPVVFTETHQIQTNSFGLINIGIGKGDIRAGNFSTINWGGNSHYVRVEMDPAGGTNYELMGTSELLSVPYALYADKAGTGGNRAGEWDNNTTDIYVHSTYAANNVGIGTTGPGGKLHVYGTGYPTPAAPMLFIEHTDGFSSTFKRVHNHWSSNSLFLLQRARGSLGSESAVFDGDRVGQIRFEGYHGSGFGYPGIIICSVDGAPSGTSVPGNLQFWTTNQSGTLGERMRVDNNGNIGIGTIYPVGNLEVYQPSGQLDVMLNRATDASASVLHFQTAGTSEWALLSPSGMDDLFIDRSSGSGDLILAYSGGNVGVGTVNPLAHFHVYGIARINPTSQPNRHVQIGSLGGNTYITLKNSSAITTTRIESSGDSYFNGGNVAIGATSASEELHVVGNIKMVDGNEADGRLMKSNATGTGSWVNPSTIAGIWSMNGTKIYYTGGNVGIGNSNPAWGHMLSVTATAGIGAYVKTTDNLYPALYVTHSGTGNAALFYNGDVIVENGNLGIGTTSIPGSKLQIWENSTSAYQIMLDQDSPTGDAAIRLQVETVPGTTDFTAGIDNDDNNNFEISNTSSLTGSGQTDYTDANTMMRINHARNAGVGGIVDFNHQSRARAFLSDTITLWSDTTLGLFFPMPWNIDWYFRPWFPIPFNKKAPQNRSGFDEHSEFTLSAAPPPGRHTSSLGFLHSQ